MLQILADAPVMDTVLPISPLDPRQSRIKQEDSCELHVSHGAADIDYQVGWLQSWHAAHIPSHGLHSQGTLTLQHDGNWMKCISKNACCMQKRQANVFVDAAEFCMVWTLNVCKHLAHVLLRNHSQPTWRLLLSHITPAKELRHVCMLSPPDSLNITLILAQGADTLPKRLPMLLQKEPCVHLELQFVKLPHVIVITFCSTTYFESIMLSSYSGVAIQGHEERYMYRRHDSGSAAFSGSYSQLLTGHNNSSMVLVPCKNPPDQPEALEVSVNTGSAAYEAMEQPHRISAGSAAPEPYQILMPVQMADGQITALPPDQAQVGTMLSLMLFGMPSGVLSKS